MSDLRDKKPDRKTFDWTRKTKGNHRFEISLWCPTYSGIKSEDVYVKNPTYIINAMDFNSASQIAQVIAATLREAHDIWLVEIHGVAIVKS